MTRPPGYDAAWAAFSLACATETSDEDALTATLTAAEPHIRATVHREIQETLRAEIRLQEDVARRARANGYHSDIGEVSGRYAWALGVAADYLADSMRARPSP